MLNKLQFISLVSGFAFAFSAQALVIDFTDELWSGANFRKSTTVSYGDLDVTVASGTYFGPHVLTFNSAEGAALGCEAGQATHGLACDGGGLGVASFTDIFLPGGAFDQINTFQWLTVSFSEAVDISGISFLDLYGDFGEVAVVEDSQFGFGESVNVAASNVGGYWDTGYIAESVTSLSFSVREFDFLSDYSLASISVSEVPLPGSLILFGTGLLGIGMIRKHKKV